MRKAIATMRINPIIDEWFKEEAEKRKMNKSELMRRALTEFQEKEDKRKENKND